MKFLNSDSILQDECSFLLKDFIMSSRHVSILTDNSDNGIHEVMPLYSYAFKINQVHNTLIYVHFDDVECLHPYKKAL